MKVQFFGKVQVSEDEWIDLDPEKTIFEIPDEVEPFIFFNQMIPYEANYLITYNKIEE